MWYEYSIIMFTLLCDRFNELCLNVVITVHTSGFHVSKF